MATATNVTTGKPATGGAVWSAPFGTALPTATGGTLNSAFVELGYCSEDGLTNNNTPSSENIKAWGGDIVYTYQSEKEDTFGMTLIEALNVNVLKEVYGQDNVSGDLTTGITVNANATEMPTRSFVVDQIMRDGAVKRIVIPCGKVSEIGEISYSDTAAVGYALTISAMPDTNGNTHYEYIKRT